MPLICRSGKLILIWAWRGCEGWMLVEDCPLPGLVLGFAVDYMSVPFTSLRILTNSPGIHGTMYSWYSESRRWGTCPFGCRAPWCRAGAGVAGGNTGPKVFHPGAGVWPGTYCITHQTARATSYAQIPSTRAGMRVPWSLCCRKRWLAR